MLNPLLEAMYKEYQYEKEKEAVDKNVRLGDIILRTQEEDEKHRKWDYYYDAMEYLAAGDEAMAELLLKKSIDIDNNFVAAYWGMACLAQSKNNFKEEKKYSQLAFAKSKKVFPTWPKEMRWGILENRPYLRAIASQAFIKHIEGSFKEAEKLYRLLLRLNPNDNQGIRYVIAGMFTGLKPQDIDNLFDEGNAKQDWSKLKNLLSQQNKKHHFWQEPPMD